jgi:regulatory protein
VFPRSKKPLDAPALYDYAIRALSRRMRTVAELKRLLRQRVASDEEGEAAVEAVILKLKDQKYLNDSQYAATYSSYRQATEKFGRRRVAADLRAKGVHPEVIEKSLTSAYAGVNEEQLARQHLVRKRLRKPRDQKDAARIFRALARAGFSAATIFRILKKWDVDSETLSALESESEI